MPIPLSLRYRFLLVMLCAAVVPLGLLGLWLTQNARDSGEALLRARLDSALVLVARQAGSEWTRHRSALLDISEHERVRDALGDSSLRGELALPDLESAIWLSESVESASMVDARDRTRWTLDLSVGPRLVAAEADSTARDRDVITVSLPVFAEQGRAPIGRLEARLRPQALLSTAGLLGAGVGAVIAVIDQATGGSVIPLPFDPALLETGRFMWAGEQWLVAKRVLAEPALTLYASAPLDPFTLPFTNAARRGAWALASLTLAAILAGLLLSARLTRSLEALASAADAVTAGNLERSIDLPGRDEVARVASAFNAMTDSLRRTLRRLSERQAVAAVGEFASTLAHEVRNPLSAIRLNLQSAEEQLTDGSRARAHVAQALKDIQRVDDTVAGALRIARSGSVERRGLDVREPILAAMRIASPHFAESRAALSPLECDVESPVVRGDSAALERLFLNLMLNSAQAVAPGGRAVVSIRSSRNKLVVRLVDDGRGMDDAHAARAFDPFFSTRPDGTGLGLAVARQIAVAHEGDIEIESARGRGTTVKVTLDLAPEACT